MQRLITAGAVCVLATGTAFAHITLENGEASVGSAYKAVLRVPHGCEGTPTNTVRVQVPEGVIAVKPQPKAGWKLEKIRAAYSKSYDYYGAPASEGVKEIVWSGGNLGDDEYDEFIFRSYLTPVLEVGKTMYFPIVQECAEGKVQRWIEIPAVGQSDDDLELPAPGIKLLGKAIGH